MHIYIASDHRGFVLKKTCTVYLSSKGYRLTDVGNTQLEPNDDYPDFASKLAISMKNETDRGIVICGSGVGVSIVANRYSHIRCVLGFGIQQIAASRSDDDTNVLALAADFITPDNAQVFIETFLTTTFKNEEVYKRRIHKIDAQPHTDCSCCSCQH